VEDCQGLTGRFQPARPKCGGLSVVERVKTLSGGNEMHNFTNQAILGFIRLQLFLALLLFLPAWSLRFWQAWLYWILFSASVLFITLYFLKHDPALIARRIAVGPSAEQEKRQKIIQAIAGVLSCIVFMVPGFDHRFHWSSVPARITLAADALVVLGLLIVFRVFQENSYTASTVQVAANQPVISTGPYAWIRHPMYAGIALDSLWALLPAVLLCAVVVARLLDEERYLSENLLGYDAYCQKVRHRLIPYVW
jgi:protein-S-isoprenylcysteine O-methyltransferase Ste14